MKVAVIHNLGRGGARRRLAEQVARLDGEVVEVCFDSSVAVTDAPRTVALTQRAGAATPLLRPPLRYADLAALVAAWRRVARLVRGLDADVVYANPCRFLQAPAALLDRGLPPVVYFCDEPRRVDYEPDAAAMRSARTRRLYSGLYAAERRLDQRAVARARALLTNSRYTASTIRAAYGREATPIVMGVPAALAVTAPAGAPEHLLSVGTLIAGKGHDLVLRAAAAAGGRWPVVVVAPRPEDAERRRLEGLAAELGVALDVRVAISDEELRDLYRAAHATLYLARAEPLGLVSLEAQAAGCPVIVADQGGLPETVVAGESGFVVPREAAAAAEAIVALEDPAVRGAMARAARQNAGRWTWDASARAVQACLEATAR